MSVLVYVCVYCGKGPEGHYLWRDGYLHHKPERWWRR